MQRTQYNWIASTLLAVVCPLSALADISGTPTLSANSSLSLDTGTVGTSGGDILWTGTSLTFQGTARGAVVPGLTGAAFFNQITQAILQQPGLAQLATTTPIPASALSVGAIAGVVTNAGNAAKILVTAVTGTSISLQFTTFGASSTGGAPTPTISDILNGSSTVPQGFPNYGIPPSSLFVVRGANLANAGNPVLQDSTKGLPLTLNGASISVTVAGKTVTPAIYYTSPTQVAAVLPAATPVGTGTLTLTYNNVPSAPATIQVIAAGVGIDTYNGSGIATDAVTGALLTYINSGTPGETIVLWGTGLGADPNDSDTTYTSTPHQVTTPLQIYIGSVQVPQANILYEGASVYPGVDVIGLTIPANAPTGCNVSLAAVTNGNVVSNIVTLPINAGGGVCSDPALGTNGTAISTLSGQTSVKYGSVILIQSTVPAASGTTVSTLAEASFEGVTSASFLGGSLVSLGGCTLNQSASAPGTLPMFVGLDAGTITLSGPSVGPVTVSQIPTITGIYEISLPATTIPSTGGSFVFTGSGGKDVGQFTATINFPNLLTWNNQSVAATVTRSSGLNVAWNGGASGSYVIISGSSVAAGGAPYGSYTCLAPVSAGQFTVPSYVLLGLPAGSGTTTVENSTNISTFSAQGIDQGSAFGAVSVQVNSAYK
jgi:uncharacterized protein (TIGR03437 family)